MDYSYQGGQVAIQINGIGKNGVFLSSQTDTNEFNTRSFLREPVNNPQNLTSFMGGVSDSSDSTLRDTWTQNNLENSTPGGFSGCVISDFYEVFPITESHNIPVTDPHTGLTSGPAYYVGYFQLCPDGGLTFVRASETPPPELMIGSVGANTTISFPSTSGAVYTLYYTNASGLSSPVTTWPSLPGTITGDGSVKSFSDSSADSERFYRVGVH